MKTIEELRNAYVAPIVEAHAEFRWYDAGELEEMLNDTYAEGAKAAQVWISVEDELPKWGEIILVKINNEDDMLSTARHQGNGHFAVDCQELYRYNVTHWRPIERK